MSPKPLAVKICGLTRKSDIDVAIEGGAAFLGFIFYPPSKRSLSPQAWTALATHVDGRVPKVGVFVDADDDWIDEVQSAYPLDVIQLHGKETAERVAELRKNVPTVVKSLPVSEAGDVELANAYADVADMILFDAKPPKTPDAIPGGNGLAFDWRLLQGQRIDLPWLLSGGISAANLELAIERTGASMVDLSSSIEDAPGLKNTGQMQELLAVAKTLGSS